MRGKCDERRNIVDLLATRGLRVQTLCAVENLCIIYNLALHISSSQSVDSTNLGLCSIVVFTIEKNLSIVDPPNLPHVGQGQLYYISVSSIFQSTNIY